MTEAEYLRPDELVELPPAAPPEAEYLRPDELVELPPDAPPEAEYLRPDELVELPPDAPPEAGGGEFDPVADLSMLTQANAQRMNALSNQGVQLQESHTMIQTMLQNALLEEILTALSGQGAVVRVLLDTHRQIADTLTAAEQSVSQAKLMSPHIPPQHNGRVTRPGRLT